MLSCQAATWRDRAVTLESRLERAHSDREEALQSAASWRRRCEKVHGPDPFVMAAPWLPLLPRLAPYIPAGGDGG